MLDGRRALLDEGARTFAVILAGGNAVAACLGQCTKSGLVEIVHAAREPMDLCFACYRQLFVSGNETLYDLADIAAVGNTMMWPMATTSS